MSFILVTSIIEVVLRCKVKLDYGFSVKFKSIDPKQPNIDYVENKMGSKHTISQLAKSAGVPITTLRYYERIGLVKPEERSHGNYRLYGNESLQKVKFIRAAQATGFTLEDVKALLLDDFGEVPTCRSVQGLIEDRLVDIEKHLKDLRHVRRVLKSALERCQMQKKTDCCHVVESLHSRS